MRTERYRIELESLEIVRISLEPIVRDGEGENNRISTETRYIVELFEFRCRLRRGSDVHMSILLTFYSRILWTLLLFDFAEAHLWFEFCKVSVSPILHNIAGFKLDVRLGKV